MNRSDEYYVELVRELCTLPNETEWVEFKVNVQDPEGIGEYVSALANSAAIIDKHGRTIVCGEYQIMITTVVGIDFNPRAKKVGNEELDYWMSRLIEPGSHFQFM